MASVRFESRSSSLSTVGGRFCAVLLIAFAVDTGLTGGPSASGTGRTLSPQISSDFNIGRQRRPTSGRYNGTTETRSTQSRALLNPGSLGCETQSEISGDSVLFTQLSRRSLSVWTGVVGSMNV